MDFTVARPDVVRAINQRWLLKFWKRHLGTQRVPPWQAVDTEDLSRVADGLSYLDVVNDGDGGPRFRIQFHGATIGRVFGAADCRGKFLYDSMPAEAREHKLVPYRHAVQTGCPVYTVHDIKDRAGRLIHYERLMLPFSRGGEAVDRILTSFEFICPDGGYDGAGLMQAQTAPPALRLSAVIEPQGMV